MTSDRWLRVKGLFEAAAGRPAAERTAFLAGATGGDDALRAEVERLLEAGAEADAYFDTLGLAVGAATDDRARVEAVGPYRLLEPLGFGGMGAVYRARREDGQFRRDVAVKLIRRGVHSHEAARRFRVERQALAALRHTNIARLYDGGVTADGQPWLAMELVEGEPVTAYCDRQRLSVDDRLALFLQVCEAVQHAHRRLVVHRDLKPSNVLVAEEDPPDGGGRGAPCVKLLDFGLAKLLDRDPGVTVPVTAPDRRILTPEYAAPEQVTGGEVTTATDVYALGVLLYELLAGRRPDAPDREPTRPSAAALQPHACRSTHGETRTVTPAEAAAARATTPARLGRRLRGDLDRIALKALRPEPERRYATADALARDVRRHRAGLPVEARPATVRYRVGRFVRRHRQGVATAASVVLALVALTAAYTARLADAREAAEAERAAAEATVGFLVDLFREGDPLAARGDTATVYDLLDRGAAEVQTAFADHPRERARLQTALARIYQNLGTLGRADSLYRAARRLSPVGSPGWLEAQVGLADVLKMRGRYPASERAYREALAEAPPERRLVVLSNLAALLRLRGDLLAADSLYAHVLDGRREAADPALLAADLHNVGVLRADLGRADEGARALREALALKEQTAGPDHLHTALTLNSLAVVEQDRGRLAEAERLYRRALAVYQRHHGRAHADIAAVWLNLGDLAHVQGDYDGAIGQYQSALAMWRATLGEEHPYVALALLNVGWALHDAGRYAEAEPYYRDALARDRAALGDDHVEVGADWVRLGLLYLDTDRAAEAEAAFREAERCLAGGYPADHAEVVEARVGLARALGRLGRPAEAAAVLQTVPARPDGLDDRTAAALDSLRRSV
jgi:serine/threonine-protein kinase